MPRLGSPPALFARRAALARHALLGVNVLAALNAANAWRPFARRSVISPPCFVAGWPTSELPVHALAAHVAAGTAIAATTPTPRREAAFGAALGVGAAGLMVAQHNVARRAGDVYEAALRSALGPEYRDRIVVPEFPGPDAATARMPGVLRMARVRGRYAHDSDISYGPAGGRNLLDIWRREDIPQDSRAPVLLQIPGGAWMVGNKQGQAYPLMSHMVEQGWICVSMSYRLSPRDTWPAQIVDVKRAVHWVRENIANHGGDPGFIVLTGGSAGGHLSALAALTPGVREWQPGFEDADTSVAAAAPFYGAFDLADHDNLGHRSLLPFLERMVMKTRQRHAPHVFDDASPMRRIHAAAPPFLISHGTNDSLIPVEQARLFAQRLGAASRNPVVYAELPRAQHAFDIFGSARAGLAAQATSRFLGLVYGDHVRARVAAGP